MLKLIVVILATLSISFSSYADEGKKVKMKTYRHSVFSVSVPMDWEEKRESNDETVILNSKNGKDQLTISVMHFKPGTKKEDLKKSFERHLVARHQAEKVEAKGKVMLTDAKINDNGDFLYSKYGGYEKSIDRRFIALVTAEKGKLFTFYVESIGTSDEYTNNIAAEIFNSVEVK